jgi:hypothetical protein
MPHKANNRSRGADPPKKVSGSTGTDSSGDPRRKSVKAGNGPCIAPISLSSAEPLFILLMTISDMRSQCSNAAVRFSTFFSFTPESIEWLNILIGKGGQISSNILVGFVGVQRTRRRRRRGDPRIIYRHRRHTWVRIFQLRFQDGRKVSLVTLWDTCGLHKSNISRRTSSRSLSIIAWPTVDQSRLLRTSTQCCFYLIFPKVVLGDTPNAQGVLVISLSLEKTHHRYDWKSR